jgi:hypothetical protein
MESVPREVERRVRTGALYIVTGGAAHGSISACARCDISLYTSMFKAHPAAPHHHLASHSLLPRAVQLARTSYVRCMPTLPVRLASFISKSGRRSNDQVVWSIQCSSSSCTARSSQAVGETQWAVVHPCSRCSGACADAEGE